MNIHPLWPKELETTTKYEYLDLLKLVTIILENYNEVKINNKSFNTEEIIGAHPIKYDAMKVTIEAGIESTEAEAKVY